MFKLRKFNTHWKNFSKPKIARSLVHQEKYAKYVCAFTFISCLCISISWSFSRKIIVCYNTFVKKYFLKYHKFLLLKFKIKIYFQNHENQHREMGQYLIVLDVLDEDPSLVPINSLVDCNYLELQFLEFCPASVSFVEHIHIF